MADLQARIEELWEHRTELGVGDPDAVDTVREAIDALDQGLVRVAEVHPDTREVTVNAWLKQAILLLSLIHI